MDKINFQNLPSTSTPINATNLNQLQTNVENAINAVVESGSTANGNYIKYPDGTMICTVMKEGSTFDCTSNSEGNFFYTGTGCDISWTYPQAFLSNTTPCVTFTVRPVASATNMFCTSSLSVIGNDYCLARCALGKAVTGVKFIWNFIAIGKWK